MTHHKYAIKGVKKLFSLAKTKIRLARQADTIYTKPSPLPLVKYLSNIEVNTVEEAERHLEKLKQNIDYNKPKSMAETVFQLLDIIEGVKHKYEPKEYFSLLTQEGIKKLLEENEVNLLLACQPAGEGINLYIGENPPENTIHYGRVTTNLASLIAVTLPDSMKKLHVRHSGKTLINNAIYHAMETYGASLR